MRPNGMRPNGMRPDGMRPDGMRIKGYGSKERGLSECGPTECGLTECGQTECGLKDTTQRNAAYRNAAQRNGFLRLPFLPWLIHQCYNQEYGRGKTSVKGGNKNHVNVLATQHMCSRKWKMPHWQYTPVLVLPHRAVAIYLVTHYLHSTFSLLLIMYSQKGMMNELLEMLLGRLGFSSKTQICLTVGI